MLFGVYIRTQFADLFNMQKIITYIKNIKPNITQLNNIIIQYLSINVMNGTLLLKNHVI